MQYSGILRIKSRQKIIEFLNSEHTGRIASIDEHGYPQIIPMNFAFEDGCIWMHSHTRGEKIRNAERSPKVGFEVDRELEFLPSYFEDPHDASLADTLYISVVIKGTADIIRDRALKARALNALMLKYQPEGRYSPVLPEMDVVDAVAIIRITPDLMHGKYKIGQHLSDARRSRLAMQILERHRDSAAAATLDVMGFDIIDGRPRMRTADIVW